MIVRAIVEWDEETETYTATCPKLSFVSSFGDTKQEAISYLKDAINLMLEPISDNLIKSLIITFSTMI
ncbi:hypothetical protein GM3709_543 [Geminocystis sp. NIES-3709]|nr:hypothetical protein GM3709_543 [Geminocystis sp. NIES-3709]